MIYPDAHKIALAIKNKLEPFCEEILIAGSIAREKPEVKDIELVLFPRELAAYDLFGVELGKKRLPAFCNEVRALGKILKGDIENGRYIQIALKEGINLDLFIPQRHDFVRQYSIRVGPSEYSHKVLATAWRRLGWVGTENGLRLEKESYAVDLPGGKKKWVCDRKNPTLPPIWETEWHLFKFLGLEWIPPQKRYV